MSCPWLDPAPLQQQLTISSIPVIVISSPQLFDVQVGANQLLSFDPASVTAKVGDVVRFTFHAVNHTLTQSSLDEPCVPSNAFDTGFTQFNAADSDTMMIYLTVNTPDPQYFFCHQSLPISHCELGMVFAINPGGNFDTFLNNVFTVGPLSALVTSLPTQTVTFTSQGAIATSTLSGVAVPDSYLNMSTISTPSIVLPTADVIASDVTSEMATVHTSTSTTPVTVTPTLFSVTTSDDPGSTQVVSPPVNTETSMVETVTLTAPTSSLPATAKRMRYGRRL